MGNAAKATSSECPQIIAGITAFGIVKIANKTEWQKH
jgi:hypothetical protein